MIGIITRKQSFADTIETLLSEKSEIIYGNFLEAISPKATATKIVERFNSIVAFKNVSKPVYYVSVSPNSKDYLTNVDWSELAKKLVQELGLEKNQVIGILHRGEECLSSQKISNGQMHLIANAINCESQSTNFYQDYYKLTSILKDFEKERKKQKGIGDILSNSLPISILEDLDNFATKTKTHETALNGIDLASYSISSISSICKLASLFLTLSKEDKSISNELNAVLEAADEIEHLLPSGEKPQFLVEGSKREHQLKFIEDAKLFLDSQSQKLLVSDKTDLVHEKFLNYFRSVDSLNQKPEAEKYTVQGNILGQIFLVDSEQEKAIEITVANKLAYSSSCKEGNWLVEVDLLSQKEKRLIANLPQTENEVVLEYSGRYLAKFLDAKFKSVGNSEQVTWKYESAKTNDIQEKFYNFHLVEKNDRQVIKGINEQGKKVFSAELLENRSINVLKNNIPLSHLQKLINLQKKYQRQKESHQESRKKLP